MIKVLTHVLLKSYIDIFVYKALTSLSYYGYSLSKIY